jgi:hypothetical protein
MPGTYGQQWSRYIRPGYSDQNMRVSDAERAEVADRLAVHYSDGRLDRAEFDERVARAMSAKTRADLNGLFDDLPDTDVAPGAASPGSPAGTAVTPERRGRPCRRGHPVLVLVLAIVLASMATHMVVHIFFIPWLWVAALAAVIVFVTRASARTRRDR